MKKSDEVLKSAEGIEDIRFVGNDDKIIMRLTMNGDIYVHEKKVENDKEVVDGLRYFLASYGY